MFHRIGAAAYKADLKNTIEICSLLDNPEKKFRSVHIAGTNGKGSTSHMLAAIFQSAGYKTGLYTSPHLKDFRERIRVNGKMIEEKKVTEFVERYKGDFEKIKPSFFEWTVGLAFDHFANEQVDIAIIETGLGGRLDSTNVVLPELSIITNIGRDHMNLLGDTAEKIAAEKAGIMKPGVPVLVGQDQPDVKEVFLRKASELNVPLEFADHLAAAEVAVTNPYTLKITNRKTGKAHYYETDLRGTYQLRNVVAVIAAVEELRKSSLWQITDGHIASGLKSTCALTGLQGRWQRLDGSPPTYCDVAHNEDGIRELLECISREPHQQLHFVFGVVADKSIDGILDLLPAAAIYYFCKADLPRSLEAPDLQRRASQSGLKGSVYPSAKAALRAAQQRAGTHDLVVVTGSTFVVAEIL